MKVLKLIAFLLITNYAYSQDINLCEQVVAKTIASINQKDFSLIEQNLGEQFSIAGHTGSVARMILKQLVNQLNDEVDSYEKIQEEQKDGTLSLTYNFIYKKRGSKKVSFLFDQSSKLKELELVTMEVKTMKDETKVVKTEKDVVEIPFRMASNLIAVDVLLNSEKRTFILDSGAPKVILNKEYIEETTEGEKLSSLKGVSGTISNMDIVENQSVDFGGVKIENQELLALDLAHLEKELETEIYGLIGYELLKDYDILFDYSSKQITLIKPEAFANYQKENLANEAYFSVPLEMNNHIPILTATIGNESYQLGIDCGAESNLMNERLYPLLKKYTKKTHKDTLVGADNNPKKVVKGHIKEMHIGESLFTDNITVFSNIDHLNEAYKLQLDGLVGFQLLSKQRTLLSYKRKELIFIKPKV